MASEANFIEAVNFTIEEEGGSKLVNDPSDPGGLTKYGIASKYHPGVDIKGLTRDQAVGIYRKEYWQASGCPKLPRGFALALFDNAVHHGVWGATVALQSALGTTADGIIGLRTVAATMWFGAKQRLDDYLITRLFEYFQTAPDDKRLGFCRRVLRLKELISNG